MTRLSFEFFPPRESDGVGKLMQNVVPRLQGANPLFYSVTYGAGGSTREGTFETVAALLAAGHQAAPHLSMGADADDTVVNLLERYREIGVRRIVALRGDVPSGLGRSLRAANAQALVTLIRKHFADYFEIEVAAYPEVHPDAASPESDLDFFAAKVDAGATSAITQYFYSPYAYYDFRERCEARGITIPIHVGIMPITSVESIVRFSAKAGADIPRWMLKKLESIADDEAAVRDFGCDVCVRLCEELLKAGAPGFHLYTLNRWGASRRIVDALSVL
jgi:methylenetetrahydrofolate reductase (NADPH)